MISYTGANDHGKKKYQRHTVHGTTKGAEAELTRMLGQVDRGSYVSPVKMTVADFLAKWLADPAQPSVEHKTFGRYREIVKWHLTPALGGRPLTNLQPVHIQGHYG